MLPEIPLLLCVPFVIILLMIAIMPLAFPHFWESNRNKAVISAIVSIPVLIFLFYGMKNELFAAMEDYFSFIILLASLFIISGGIVMSGDLRATPKINSIFLFSGAVVANLIGTTGASMLMIRPFLRTNSERKNTSHIPVFFIFLVSNIGGSLTPLGDPPLFLGYLNGVPFGWTLKLFPIWFSAVLSVLIIFYFYDKKCYKKESKEDIEIDILTKEPIRIKGLINLVFLLGVVLSVLLQIPAPYRELVMILMAALSLIFTKKDLHEKNQFTFGPIIEVAVLFAGIFITMTPLVMLLKAKGASLGITEPWQYFWATGILSSFLDNAPTYFTYFSLAQSVTHSLGSIGIPVIAGVQETLLKAISCGAVFMGANTYIGNGPNFMVKSIAESQGYKLPHFFGYMLYSGAVLIPVFLIITLIFFI
jgi:Na+/H+ antiporter NhaD/arsenite permease-like protein